MSNAAVVFGIKLKSQSPALYASVNVVVPPPPRPDKSIVLPLSILNSVPFNVNC